MKVTALAGGVGGAKLLVGLDRTDAAEDLTAVVNVGDDAEIYGVHVSPDVDIVTYWLAGVVDSERGWGIEKDTFTVVDALGRLGYPNWFLLGDQDFATCIYRTQRLADGARLTEVTREIATSLGVGPTIVPATEDRVRTHVVTEDGRDLPFQEYFVKERTQPEVTEVRYDGIESARPGPGVLETIAASDVVVVCPSNPVLSVAPITGLVGVREALVEHPLVVAVSPIVGGAAIKGPADRLLKSLGGDSTAAWVAHLYHDFCDLFVIDSVDADSVERVESEGPKALVLDTIMSDHDASARVAGAILAAVSQT